MRDRDVGVHSWSHFAALGLEKIPPGTAALAQCTHRVPRHLPGQALKPLLFFAVTRTPGETEASSMFKPEASI